VAALSFHHRDPFDRLIVAQAVEEGLPVISADPVFQKYGLKCILVNTDLLAAPWLSHSANEPTARHKFA